jgi:hypothetical protein
MNYFDASHLEPGQRIVFLDGTPGTVQFLKDDYVSVVWDDGITSALEFGDLEGIDLITENVSVDDEHSTQPAKSFRPPTPSTRFH